MKEEIELADEIETLLLLCFVLTDILVMMNTIRYKIEPHQYGSKHVNRRLLLEALSLPR